MRDENDCAANDYNVGAFDDDNVGAFDDAYDDPFDHSRLHPADGDDWNTTVNHRLDAAPIDHHVGAPEHFTYDQSE